MKYGRVCLAAWLMVLPLAASSSGVLDVDSLLAVSVGGPEAVDSLRRVTSYRTEGTIDLNGMTGQYEQVFVAPDLHYLKVNFGPFSIVQAYDGEVPWQVTLNGQTTVMEGYERREFLKGLYFDSFSYLFSDRLPGSKTYLGDTVIQDRHYHVLAFVPLNLDTVRAYYELETGLPTRMTAQLDNFDAVQYCDDYREVSGILVPHRRKVVAEQAGLTSEIVTESIALNVAVDRSIFAMPGEQTTDFYFPPGVTAVDIGFSYRAGHIRIPAVINGERKAWFILDSGSSATFLHQPIGAGMNLDVVGTLPARGVGGFRDVDLVRIDSIAIGRVTLYDQVAGVVDLSQLDRVAGAGEVFGGLLGYDFLSRFPVEVSYRDSTLRLFDPASFEPPDKGVEVPFHLTMSVPTVRAELNGIPGDFLIDLGNALGLIVHHGFSAKHQLEKRLDDVRDNSEALAGVGGSVAGKNAFAATFKIGDILIQSLRVILPESTAGVAGSEELAGNIGNMVLENFDILFDYQQSRLIFYEVDQ